MGVRGHLLWTLGLAWVLLSLPGLPSTNMLVKAEETNASDQQASEGVSGVDNVVMSSNHFSNF